MSQVVNECSDGKNASRPITWLSHGLAVNAPWQASCPAMNRTPITTPVKGDRTIANIEGMARVSQTTAR